MATTQQTITEEVIEAREQTAARLERLATFVRQSEGASIEAWDDAYSEISKMAGKLRTILHNVTARA